MKIDHSNIGEKLIVEMDANNDLHLLKKLSDSEYYKLKNADQVLYVFNLFLRKAIEVQLNLEDFEKAKTFHLESYLIPNSNSEYGEMVLIDLNRIFNNIISSFVIFVNQFEADSKKYYRDEPQIFSAVKQKISESYDKNFEHRLIYQLRNFTQHQQGVINNIKFDKSAQSIRPFIQKERLLADNKIKKKIGIDLSLYNDLIPIEPILNKLYIILNSLSDDLLKIIFKRHKNSAKHLYSVIKEFPNKFMIGYCEIIKGNSREIKVDLNIVSQSLIKSIQKEFGIE